MMIHLYFLSHQVCSNLLQQLQETNTIIQVFLLYIPNKPTEQTTLRKKERLHGNYKETE